MKLPVPHYFTAVFIIVSVLYCIVFFSFYHTRQMCQRRSVVTHVWQRLEATQRIRFVMCTKRKMNSHGNNKKASSEKWFSFSGFQCTHIKTDFFVLKFCVLNKMDYIYWACLCRRCYKALLPHFRTGFSSPLYVCSVSNAPQGPPPAALVDWCLYVTSQTKWQLGEHFYGHIPEIISWLLNKTSKG